MSGALVSALMERAAVAANGPSAQDPQLTTLLKYVSVDPSGNVAIKGGNITIQSSGNIDIATTSGNSNIKGQAVNINTLSGKTTCCPWH